MRQHELVETILDAFAELAALHAAAAATAERAWSLLAEHDEADLRCPACRHQACPSGRPVVNTTTFSVEWRGRLCALGPTIQFKLIQRLSRRTERYYPYTDLMEDVWDRRCSNTTVRSAVKRLRRALCDAGMDDLAEAIKGRGECYGLFLNGDGF